MKFEVKYKCCGQKPEEIIEYIVEADEEGITPEQFVVENEGTFNPVTGRFYCTNCYVKVGMPCGIA